MRRSFEVSLFDGLARLMLTPFVFPSADPQLFDLGHRRRVKLC